MSSEAILSDAGTSSGATSTIPATMRAVEIVGRGGPEVLRVTTRPVPSPGLGEVLVRVMAAGINRCDSLQRTGAYVPPDGASDIPGVEVAGHIVALGQDCRRFEIGDRVCGLVVGGGYADYCVVPEAQTLPIPRGLADAQAAGVPETFFTVWNGMVDQGRLKPGDSILIHGGASGIGTTAIMLARALGAGSIFATAGSPEKCETCRRIGATVAINYKTQDFVEEVRDATAGRGVDVILDIVAGDYVPRNLSLLADDGRLVFMGQMAELGDVRTLNFEANIWRIMFSRLTVTGMSLRGQSVERKAAIGSRLEAVVWPLLADGTLAPVIDSVFTPDRVADAHHRLDSLAHTGKMILNFG